MSLKKHMQVMEFINTLKGHRSKDGHDAHHILNQIYSRGNCYMFARTLKLVFPEGELYNYQSYGTHILFKLEGRFYDISGDVTALYRHSIHINPITEEQEDQARTFCYSYENKGACALDDNAVSMSEEEFRKRLRIQDKIEVEDHVDYVTFTTV